MLRRIAALGAAVAVGAGGYASYENVGGSSPGPKATVYGFVHAIKTGNFGKACSRYTQKFAGGSYEACRLNFAFEVSNYAQWLGESPYAELSVVPGSETQNEDGSYEYLILLDSNQYAVTVTKSDVWRISSIKPVTS